MVNRSLYSILNPVFIIVGIILSWSVQIVFIAFFVFVYNLDTDKTSDNVDDTHEISSEEDESKIIIEYLGREIELQDFDKVAINHGYIRFSKELTIEQIYEMKREFEENRMVEVSELVIEEEMTSLAVSTEDGLIFVNFLIDGLDEMGKKDGDKIIFTELHQVKTNLFIYTNFDTRLYCVVIAENDSKAYDVIGVLERALRVEERFPEYYNIP